MNLGPTELLILGIGFIPLALTLWAVVDAAVRPDWAFIQSGQNKVLWIVLPIAASFVCLGWLAAIVYLAAIRSKVAAAQSGGGYPPGYGGPPPPGYGGPPPYGY